MDYTNTQYKLRYISFEELSKYSFLEYQRLVVNKGKVKAIIEVLNNSGKYTLLPIVVSEDFLIVDGGHRVTAFRAAFLNGSIEDGIWVLIDNIASKETFIQLNMGTPVSIAHKLYISNNIKKMRDNGFSFIEGSSTKSSIGVADFARAYYVFTTYGIFKQASAKVLIDFINECDYESLVTAYRLITNITDKYYKNLSVGQRYLQKHFLYFIWMERKKVITDRDYEKVVPRLPNSLGGDIGMLYNKTIFLECFNFGKKKSRIDLSIFDNSKEVA